MLNASSSTIAQQERIAWNRLWWVGLLTIVAAAIANVLVRTLAVALFGVSSEFELLQPGAVAGSTVLFLVLAVGAFALVGRFSRQPITLYRRIAVVALILSLFNPLAVGLGLFPVTGTVTVGIVVTMLVMHVVAAAIAVGLLTTLGREQ